MEVLFLDTQKIEEKQYIEFLYDNDLKYTRGLFYTYKEKDICIINLDCALWKILKEDDLIDELTKTIAHESIHCSLKDMKIPVVKEERLARKMAKQDEGFVAEILETFI